MTSTSRTSRRLIPATTSTSTRLGAGLLTLFLAVGVAACSAGGDARSAMDGLSVSREAPADSAGDAALYDQNLEKDLDGANRTVVQIRAVIKTGQIATTSKDLDEVRQEVDQLLFGFGGQLAGEQTSHDDEGRIERSTLVLRVPVTKFDAAMDALEKLGVMKTSDSNAKDVTTELIDVNERVQTTQESLDRLQGFLSRSQNIDDLIRFEREITTREAELQSLTAQQSYLNDQTSMSTITLYLSTATTYIEQPGALDDAGFLAGLESGWNALKVFAIATLTVVGVVIPSATAVALFGVPTWLLLRAIRRRNRASTPIAPPATD